MRIASCIFAALALLANGCRPDEEGVPGGSDRDTRPGAAHEDTGTDRSPAGSGSENAAPPLRPPSNSPGSSATPAA